MFINAKVNNDPYFILGVEKEAEMKSIKKAYFELAKKHHPDMNPNDEAASKQFQQIQEAYRYIQLERNPLLKEKYLKEFKQYEQTTESDFKSKRGSKADDS